MGLLQIDTMQHKREKEDTFQPIPDIHKWLKDNRLEKKFKSNFEENDVITEDLLKYDEDTIKLCIYNKLLVLLSIYVYT